MSDYDSEAARQEALVNEYNRLVERRNRLVQEHNMLVVDTQQCEADVAASTQVIRAVHNFVLPPLSVTEDETIKKETIAHNALLVINDTFDAIRRLDNSSTASKELTGLQDKYYTLYGLYAELRNISLGYIVGLDKNFWTGDVQRKQVEKMYLANTDYWLAYATMAVMLWASDEQEACVRAVNKAMQCDERRASLFFLLTALRFNRVEAAKEWYRVYFDLVDLGGVGEEIIYILQVLLSGALGADLEFGRMVQQKIRDLLAETTNNLNTRKETQEAVNRYFDAVISVTRKEYLDLKHICNDYDGMIALLSDAEKNELLRAHFHELLTTQSELSDRISERIEDALYSLISSYDASEQELFDKIAFKEMVVKADGNMQIAEEAYRVRMAERKKSRNLALIMTMAALDPESKADLRVKKFALDFIRNYCINGAERFAQYRKREKKEYDLNVDGCALKGDENSFEPNKEKLLQYYDGIVKQAVKQDKAVKTLKTTSVIFGLSFAVFLLLTVLGFALEWGVAPCVVFIIFMVLCVGAVTMCFIFKHSEAVKIRKAYEYRINNGIKMLEDGLADMAAWRKAYHEADKVYEELIKVLKEEVVNG